MKRTPVVCGLVLVAVLCNCPAALASSGGAGLTAKPSKSHSSSSASPTFARTLRMGQSGSDVRRLQTWLAELGYNVPATGYFGSMTKSAVEQFQQAHRLSPASGSVGSRTASILHAAVRKLAQTPSSNSTASDPIPGFRLGRDDMGVDASARTGAAIYAPLASRLDQVMQDWYGSEPLLLFKFVRHSPGALSDYWYVAEQINPVTTKVGTMFHAGARVASFASSGTGIEIGWGSPTSWTRTLAGASDSGASNPPAGSKTRWGESFKKFFGIT